MLAKLTYQVASPLLALCARLLAQTPLTLSQLLTAGAGLAITSGIAIYNEEYRLAGTLILATLTIQGISTTLAHNKGINNNQIAHLHSMLHALLITSGLSAFIAQAPHQNAVAGAFALSGFVLSLNIKTTLHNKAARRSKTRRWQRIIVCLSQLSHSGAACLCLLLACFYPFYFCGISFLYAVLCCISISAHWHLQLRALSVKKPRRSKTPAAPHHS